MEAEFPFLIPLKGQEKEVNHWSFFSNYKKLTHERSKKCHLPTAEKPLANNVNRQKMFIRAFLHPTGCVPDGKAIQWGIASLHWSINCLYSSTKGVDRFAEQAIKFLNAFCLVEAYIQRKIRLFYLSG